MAHILVADDDPNILRVLKMRLASGGYEVSTATDSAAALKLIQCTEVSLALLDLKLGREDGLTLMRDLLDISPQTAVIILTAFGSIPGAVEAMRLGAFSYLTKPFDGQALLVQIRNALEQRRLAGQVDRLQGLLGQRLGLENIVGHSPVIKRVLAQVSQAAQSDANVYIEGASGTGKELIAKTLHLSSRRATGPFIAVNCAAIPENLLESELFGYAKGAFTGADRQRRGLLAEARGGTFFFDEISEMPIAMQAKLLRVIEEREFYPLGGRSVVRLEARLVAATNQNLVEAVAKGRFREDLFYRVHVIPIRLPTLAERRDDIPLLARHFLAKIVRETGKPVEDITPEAMQKLMAYAWPGNIRELENVIECAVTLSDGPVIEAPHVLRDQPLAAAGLPPFRDAKGIFERQYLRQVLEMSKGNVTQAAQLAGKYRADLYALLRKYGLNPDDFRPG
jgi:two-component system response regulator GlrR